MNASLTKGAGPGALVEGANEAVELAATLSLAGAYDMRTITRKAVPQQWRVRPEQPVGRIL